jgi:hypothetical protein
MAASRYPYDDMVQNGKLPFPILRALAYRAGVTQQLDEAACVAANKFLAEWVEKIVKGAVSIVDGRRSGVLTWIDVWSVVAREPTGSLKHLFTDYNAFKKVPTFRVFSEFERGLSPRTAREIHDLHVGWKANGNQGDFFGVDPERAEQIIEHNEWELTRKLTEEEKSALLNQVRVEMEKARDACAEYENQVPPPASVDLNRDETHGGDDDDVDNNDEADHGVGDAESDAEYECDDDDDDDAVVVVDDDDAVVVVDDDDAVVVDDGEDDDDDDEDDDMDGNSEGASVVDESLDLWAHQMRPALDAVTLEYKDEVEDENHIPTPRPEWANELASGKIGDEDTSESDRERAVAFWRDETSDCLACPIFVVKDFLREPLCSFGGMSEKGVTRDAMALFHFALEYLVVSLFEQKNPAPACQVQASLAAAKERTRLGSEAPAADPDKEAALEYKVAALKAENAELARRAKEEATRMEAVEADLKAQVASLTRSAEASISGAASPRLPKRTHPANPPAEEAKRVRRR